MATRSPTRTLVRVVGGAALGLFLLTLGLGVWFARLQATPVRRLPGLPPESLAARARRIEFPATDGLEIRGYYAPPAPGRPVLVVQHGINANRDDILPWARVLAAAGYGALCFDWRAHGESEGDRIWFGQHESRDLLGGLDWLAHDPECGPVPVGILAISMGTACCAMAAPRLPDRVRGMVLDSPFGNLARMAEHRLAPLGILGSGMRLGTCLGGLLLWGATPDSIRPEVELAAFAPRPILVFHGDQDTVIPVSEGRSLFAAYPGPKEYWESPGLGHVMARQQQTREWMRRVATFFAACLPGAPPADAVLAITPEHIP